jgi:diguanylate cyclase (GGDEF)-like protein
VVSVTAIRREGAQIGISPSTSGTSRTHLDGALKQIWEMNKQDVRSQLASAEQAVVAAVAGELGEELRELGARAAHKLAGSVGTLGFAAASKRAHEVEAVLAAGVPEPGAAVLLMDAVRDCRKELFGADDSAAARSEEPAAGSALGAEGDRNVAEALLDLLVILDDGPRADQIIAAAESRGLVTSLAVNLASARELLSRQTPTIVLLDLALGDGVDAALGLLSAEAHDLPVLVITDPRQTVDRVEVARRGGRGFLPRSLTAVATVDAVISLRQRLRPVGTRVLALDDDPVILAAIGVAMDGARLDLLTCDDPARFWAVLEEYEPDLVLLDFDMPAITGPELCRALRSDQRWGGLPVLFLTSRDSSDSIHEMFDAGADDYVRKPFVGPELLARIFNRLDRVRLYRAMADVDALTGTFNRRKAVEDIERLLRLAVRARQPLSLCILDVDNFKQINDAHGHPAGDAVLRGVGAALHRFLRGDDVIARWGGDEFVIAMYGMSADDGRHRIGEFLEGLRGARFDEDGAVAVSMSAGVAEYPGDAATLESLYRAADDALYVAKEEGRDRVVHRGSRPADGPDVLIVENNAVLGRRVEQALQTRGSRTRWITDAAEAVDALSAGASSPAPLLLLGGDPPGMDARRLLKLAADGGMLAHCRVVLLARDDPDQAVLADAANPDCGAELPTGVVQWRRATLDMAALIQLIRRVSAPAGDA